MAKHKKEKFLTLILRHQPEVAGITLDKHGWVKVTELVRGVKNKYRDFDEAALRYIVDNSEKKRFEYKDANRTLIRACQGHSVKIDLDLKPKTPPEWLYHGTTYSVIGAIEDAGIKPMKRTHVQLSADVETAYTVGLRHGNDVCILRIFAKRMYDIGYKFYQSSNGVWLVDEVPPALFIPTRPSSYDLESPYKNS
jgi:putative RNA 2'-phosphotransferase